MQMKHGGKNIRTMWNAVTTSTDLEAGQVHTSQHHFRTFMQISGACMSS